MERTAKDCTTLKQYRERVLRMTQRDVARAAGCQQAWISQVERGHLPRTWHRAALLRAYRLEAEEDSFERLVLAGCRDGFKLPLWDFVEPTGGDVVQASATTTKGVERYA
jgi:transcriptional regulator with XRE-family HTH domain